jgi:hypothetical protein
LKLIFTVNASLVLNWNMLSPARSFGKEFNDSLAIKDEDTRQDELAKKILTGKGKFVAIVNPDLGFQALAERHGMLERIAKTIGQ